MFELLEEPQQEPDPVNAVAPAVVDGRVALEDVSFSYRPEVPLIQHLNLTVQPGQRIAIVGPTGCGKTKTATPIRSTSFAAFSIAVWTRSRNTAATDKCAISGGASYEHHSISGGERGQ